MTPRGPRKVPEARWRRSVDSSREPRSAGAPVSTHSRARRRAAAAAAEAASPAKAFPSPARTRSSSQRPGLEAEWRWPSGARRTLTGACGAGRLDDRTRKSSTTIATTAATPSVPATLTAARDTRADENRRRRTGGNSRRRSASVGSTGGLRTWGPNRSQEDDAPEEESPADEPRTETPRARLFRRDASGVSQWTPASRTRASEVVPRSLLPAGHLGISFNLTTRRRVLARS